MKEENRGKDGRVNWGYELSCTKQVAGGLATLESIRTAAEQQS